MRRTAIVSITVLGLLAALWFGMGLFEAIGLNPAVAGKRTADPGPNTVVPITAANAPEVSADERKLVATPPKPSIETVPEDQAVRVRIVRGSSEIPAPEAVVRYLRSTELQSISEARRAEMRGAGWDFDRMIEELGSRAHVDENGIATVRADLMDVFVHARHGELFGALEIDAKALEPAAGWVLRLQPTTTVRVRVVDGERNPLPRVPLALQCAREGSAEGTRQTFIAAGKTNADGEATVEVGRVLTRRDPNGSLHRPKLVIHLPGMTNVGLEVDVTNPPQGVQELVAPAMGRIRIEFADTAGGPGAGVFMVGLWIAAQPGRWNNYRTADKSMPNFQRVAVGQRYSLSAQSQDGAKSLEIDGPQVAGEEVVARFVLPAMGRVRVRVLDPAGQPFITIPNYANLIIDGNGRHYQSHFGGSGVAMFERVPLGKKFKAQLDRPSMEKMFDGPVTPGSEVAVDFVVDRKTTILTGRFIDDAEEPIPGQKVRMQFVFSNGSGERILSSNDQGRFNLPLAAARSGKIVRADVRTVDRMGEVLMRSATLKIPQPLPGGITDLGDIVLTEQPLLLRGQLVGAGLHRDSGVRLTVERHRVYERRGVPVDRWRQDKAMRSIRMSEGRFEFRGEVPPGRRRLKIHSPMHLPIEPVEFELGQDDLRIEMIRGGALRATIRVDPEIRGELFEARLSPTSGQRFDADKSPLGRSGNRGEAVLEWKALHPGLYRLELIVIGQQEPILSLPDIAVVAGKRASDPRLTSLDLRGKLRRIHITIELPDGKPALQEAQVFELGGSEPQDLVGRAARRGRVELAIGPRPVDLLVRVEGFAPKAIRGVTNDLTVRMTPPHPVRFSLAGEPLSLPKGSKITLHLRSPALPQHKGFRYRTPYSSGGLEGFFQLRARLSPFEGQHSDGTISGPGPCEIFAYLVTGRRSKRLSTTPKRIEVRDTPHKQQFELTITQATIDAAK